MILPRTPPLVISARNTRRVWVVERRISSTDSITKSGSTLATPNATGFTTYSSVIAPPTLYAKPVSCRRQRSIGQCGYGDGDKQGTVRVTTPEGVRKSPCGREILRIAERTLA